MKEKLKLWQVGILAGVLATLTNLIVLYFTKPLAPEFMSLSPMPVIFWTIIAALGASIVFAIVRKLAQNPKKVFIKISILAFFISLFMDIPLFFFNIAFFAGATTGGILALMIMHAVAAIIIVPTLIFYSDKSLPTKFNI